MSVFILFSTVVISMGLGIAAAYASVVAVLQAFGRQRQGAPAQRNVAVPVLVASESHASGD